MADSNLLVNAPTHSEEHKVIEELLRSKAKRFLTPEELRAQRVSFVMGMLPHDSTLTRERVQEIVDSYYGYVQP